MKEKYNNGLVYKNKISRDLAGKKVIDFYVENYRQINKEEWQERFLENCIFVNNKPVTDSYILKNGDKLEYRRKPWVEPFVPSDFPICYEDEHIVVVDKPAKLPVLPKGVFLENTLLAIGRKQFGSYFTPMHRLDRGTSGCILCAKTKLARKVLGKQMQNREITKFYLAVVNGILDRNNFTINKPIGYAYFPKLGKVACVDDSGKNAITKITTKQIDSEKNMSLVLVELITGRTHQIRIHLSYIGFPLLKEKFYTKGGKFSVESLQCDFSKDALPADTDFYLHSYEIRFKTIAGEVKKVNAKLPDKFKQLFKEF